MRRTPRPRHIWTPAEIALLGETPDKDTPAKIGVTEAEASLMRYKQGIPPCGVKR